MAELNEVLEQINVDDVCVVLKKNFEAEKMDKFFTVDQAFTFKGTQLDLNSSNSLKLHFKTSSGIGFPRVSSVQDVPNIGRSASPAPVCR